MKRSSPLPSATLLALTLILSSANAHSAKDPVAACAKAKRVAQGIAIQALLKCHAAVATKGTVVDAKCLDKAANTLAAKFTSAEAKARKARAACTPEGDVQGVKSEVDALVSNLVGTLRPSTTASKGAGSKLKLVGKYVTTFFKAITQTPKKEIPILASAETKLLASFGKIDAKGTAQTTGDGIASSTRVKESVLSKARFCNYFCAGTDRCGAQFTSIPQSESGNRDSYCESKKPSPDCEIDYSGNGIEPASDCCVVGLGCGTDCAPATCQSSPLGPTCGQSTPLNGGEACGGDFCGHQCQAGQCVGMTRTCPDADGKSCTHAVCTSGACLPSAPDNTRCSDGEVCDPSAAGADPSTGCANPVPLACAYCATTCPSCGCVYAEFPQGSSAISDWLASNCATVPACAGVLRYEDVVNRSCSKIPVDDTQSVATFCAGWVAACTQ